MNIIGNDIRENQLEASAGQYAGNIGRQGILSCLGLTGTLKTFASVALDAVPGRLSAIMS